MRITLWLAAALALLATAYFLDLAIHHAVLATAPSTLDAEADGKWAGRFFGFSFLLMSAAVGLIILAVRAGKRRTQA
jgi:hypothetical protein